MAADPLGPLRGLPSSLAELWPSISKSALLPDVKKMEEYLDYVIAHEDSAVQEEIEDLDGIKQLTAFQVRGFRRDLMMYRKQPKESNRILRTLRRLKSKHITESVLFDTAIEPALYLLYHHNNVQVRDAAMSLMDQWMTQYPGSERIARFIQDGADKEQIEEDYEFNKGLIKDMEMVAMAPRTGYEDSSGEGEITGCPNPERHTAAVQHEESASTSANSAHVSNSCCDMPEGCHGDGCGPAVKSLVMNLGTICTDTLANIEDGTTAPQPGPDSTPYELFPRVRPDFTYRESELRSSRFGPIRSEVDFVSATRYFIGLDDRTLELLRPALEKTYKSIAQRFDFASTTGASMQTLRACSAVTQQHIDKKNAALSELDEQAGEFETISSVRKSLMEDKAKLERDLEKQGAELERVTRLHQELETDIFISVTFPLNQIMNAIGGENTETRSLFGTGAKGGVRTVNDLESGIKSLSNDLIATKKQLVKLQSEHNTVTAQLDQSRQARAELKKTIASERSNMNNKYYKDIEARVESRMQQSKARLAEAEAKSRKYDAVMTDRNRLQDELQKVTSENERQRVAKIEFDLRFRDLKEKEQATQQGYDQMRQRKDEADLRATTLEADNLALQAEVRELRELKDSLATNDRSVIHQSQVKMVEKVDSMSPTVEIVTNQHLTDTDRLDMIARRWRKDLESAKQQQEGYKQSLRETETEIAAATSQLEQLQMVPKPALQFSPPRGELRMSMNDLARLKWAQPKSSDASRVIPLATRSLPPADHTAPGSVCTGADMVLPPWMTMDELRDETFRQT